MAINTRAFFCAVIYVLDSWGVKPPELKFMRRILVDYHLKRIKILFDEYGQIVGDIMMAMEELDGTGEKHPTQNQ